jgi:sterol desaturase/sphingolipid hydroxylase (fatty acid hydroxylase superfamily)
MVDSLSAVSKSHSIVNRAIAIRAVYRNWVPEEARQYASQIFFNPILYFVVPFFLLLEYLFPYKPSQPLVGKGFLQDAIWFVGRAPTTVVLLGTAAGLLRSFYDNHLAFLTIESARAWPLFVQVMAALLLTEFAVYLSHIIRHKVPTFWFFHAVHHSQTELNVFTDDRVHIVDALVESLFRFIPFYMFQAPSLYAVAIFSVYVSIHTRLLHTNVKFNLGWLGWVVVSPQFHRVHHSADPAHFNKNFAGVLSIFGYLFGTAYPSRDVYPETGIDDAQFPVEKSRRSLHLIANWFKQMSFPFVQCFKQIVPDRPTVQKPRTEASKPQNMVVEPLKTR